MHSRIIQISNQPVDEMDYIEDWKIDEWFMEEVADSLDISDREEDIEWIRGLLSSFENISITEDDMLEIKDVKALEEEWFRERYNAFQTLAASMTFEDFAKGTQDYSVSRLMEDKRDLYIYDSDINGLMSLDKFIREFAMMNTEGQKFHIGGTLDYRY